MCWASLTLLILCIVYPLKFSRLTVLASINSVLLSGLDTPHWAWALLGTSLSQSLWLLSIYHLLICLLAPPSLIQLVSEHVGEMSKRSIPSVFLNYFQQHHKVFVVPSQYWLLFFSGRNKILDQHHNCHVLIAEQVKLTTISSDSDNCEELWNVVSLFCIVEPICSIKFVLQFWWALVIYQ
jgi:hypothetical protein